MTFKAAAGEAADAIFATFGEEATYQSRRGPSKKVLIVVRSDTADIDLYGQEHRMDVGRFRLRKSEVSHPETGDKIHHDGEWHEINEDPQIDLSGSVWLINAPPVKD